MINVDDMYPETVTEGDLVMFNFEKRRHWFSAFSSLLAGLQQVRASLRPSLLLQFEEHMLTPCRRTIRHAQ